MKSVCNRFKLGAIAAAITLILPQNVAADAAYDALKSQVEVLQKQLQQVQETLKQYEQQAATKEEVQEVRQEVAEVSTQQSEWKNTDSVVHLAGYGDVTYSDNQNSPDAFSGARFNPIFH
jgi:predicted  nucleic acid-binding Zn-ribbon protein